MNHDVFISYSSLDKEAAQAICHVLEQNEIRCWMAPRNIPPGSDYGDEIDDAIKSSKVVVVIFSETAAASQWVKGELNIAFEEQKTIIPVRIDQTPLKGQNRVMLNKTHWIDAYPDYKTKFNDVLTAVALSIGKDVQLTTNFPQRQSFSLEKMKPLLYGIILSLIIVVGLLLHPLFYGMLHTYKYDRQGLHISSKGLTEQQEEAFTAILDNMVLVEGGTFIMGNTEAISDFLTEQDSLSINPHKVDLNDFYISKYEVVQSIWRAFLPTEGRCITDGELTAMDMLSWEDAYSFADTLRSLSGLCFSLPTEAQWEYAAKGGNKSHNYIFSGHDYDATEVGWTSYDGLTSAHEVGGKRYNELGLYDMTGNVCEWCLDRYGLYSPESQANPKGPDKGHYRVIRGGDYRIDNHFDMKVTTRYFDSPFVNRKGAGVRLVININN